MSFELAWKANLMVGCEMRYTSNGYNLIPLELMMLTASHISQLVCDQFSHTNLKCRNALMMMSIDPIVRAEISNEIEQLRSKSLI